jgi:CheY-like chemotaxis protein
MDKLSGEFRILIVDDSPDIHTVLTRILSYQAKTVSGAETFTANLPHFSLDYAFQGQEAVKKVKQAIKDGKPYALAFIDIRMPPGWDGLKTIQQIWDLDDDIQVVTSCHLHRRLRLFVGRYGEYIGCLR